MGEEPGILVSGFRRTARNLRYVVWFYLLNLLLATLGALALKSGLNGILDHSLYSQRLLHGFDVFVFLELTARPELANHSVAQPHIYFTCVFLLFSLLFLPGVLDGYASERRISREDFYATCGRNVWRFVRLFLFYIVIAGIVFGLLMGIHGAIGKAAENSSNERLPFYVSLAGGVIIFLIMTWVRIWFDLAQAHVVVSDEARVRTAIRRAAGSARSGVVRLLGSYVLITMVALIVLLAGVWLWDVIVPPASVGTAFLVSQTILFIWLTARFWQRACAVAVCVKRANQLTAEQPPVPTAPPLVVPPSPLVEPSPGQSEA